MVGQAKVIVGAHVQNIYPPPDADVCLLRGSEHALTLPEAGGADLLELARPGLAGWHVHCREAPRLVRESSTLVPGQDDFSRLARRMASKPCSKSRKP